MYPGRPTLRPLPEKERLEPGMPSPLPKGLFELIVVVCLFSCHDTEARSHMSGIEADGA